MPQRTFSIIKPDAVRKGNTGAILADIEKAGFKIVSIKRMSISKAQAEGFYYVHAARPFFGELTEFMSSGPIFPKIGRASASHAAKPTNHIHAVFRIMPMLQSGQRQVEQAQFDGLVLH